MEARGTFAVRDPTDASNDVSRGSFNCQQIRIALKDAFNTLTRAITSLNRQVWDFNKKDDGISLLGCIIYVDRQAIAHRSQVLDAYTSQQWKDMPGAETFDASDSESAISTKEQVIIHKQQDVLDKKGKRRSKKDIVYVLEDEESEFKGKGNAWSSEDDDRGLSLPQLA